MSRIAKKPVPIPKGVSVELKENLVKAKGAKGEGLQVIHPFVTVRLDNDSLVFEQTPGAGGNLAMVGTMRALTQNMIHGVHAGYEKKLELVGVGYRAQAQGKELNLSLGYSHPIKYPVPEGISIETPSQTEVVVKGIDNQKVGQVAAEIRAFRPPEPYKGKGVKYANERIIRKEAKKK